MKKFILAKKIYEKVRAAEDYLDTMPPRLVSFIEEDKYVREMLMVNDALLKEVFGDESLERLYWVLYSWKPGKVPQDTEVALNTIEDALAYALKAKKIIIFHRVMGVIDQYVADEVDVKGRHFALRSGGLKDLLIYLETKNVYIMNDVGEDNHTGKSLEIEDVFDIDFEEILKVSKCENGFFEKVGGRVYYIPKEKS